METRPDIEPVKGLAAALRLRRDALGYLTRLTQAGPGVIPIRPGPETLYLLNHPDHIQRVFKTNQKNYLRSHFYDRLRPVLGDGLLTLDGPEWRRQRSAVQPSFSGVNLKNVVRDMSEVANGEIDRLADHCQTGEPFPAVRLALRLTLRIAMRVLFTRSLAEEEISALFKSFNILLRISEGKLWAPVPLPLWVPTPGHFAYRRAVATLDRFVNSMVAERLADKNPPDDLFQAILTSELSRGKPALFRKSIRDQVISVLVASHETTTSSLIWFIHTLSKMPAIGERVAAEADQVLGRVETPDFGTYQRLTYTKQVFDEVLRVYPPIWTMSRRAVEADRFGETEIPAGATVITSPYVIHRHRDFWKNPEGFDPGRFSPEAIKDRHPWAYFPFAGGTHTCLGNRFAMLEGVLVGATLMQRLNFEVVPGQTVLPKPASTLRPSSPVYVRISKRSMTKSLAAAA